MKNRHMRVLGMLILIIISMTPIFAQDQVAAPPNSSGVRVKITAIGTGKSPSGTFTTANLQFGGRPDPYSYAPITTVDCAGGPFPSGFDIEMIDTVKNVLAIRVEFLVAKDCSAPVKVGTTYTGAVAQEDPKGTQVKVSVGEGFKNCEAGTGTVKINRFDILSTKVIGSLLHPGYIDADYTFICSSAGLSGTVAGKVEYSQDNPPEGAELLNPDDVPSDGGDDGGEAPEPLPPPPPPDALVGFPSTILQSGIEMTNDSTVTVPLSTITQNGFSGDVNLEVISDSSEAEGLEVSLSTTHFPSPGLGNSTLTIRAGPNTFPRDYFVTVVTTANGKQAFNTIKVTVLCDPPMILGIDQPRAASFSGGGSASLETKAVGSGPLSYQWYRGPRSSTNFPVNGATGARLTTGDEGMYWVRVSNACGSADSAQALVTRQ